MSTQPPDGNDPYGTGAGWSDPYAGGHYGAPPPPPGSSGSSGPAESPGPYGADPYDTNPLRQLGMDRTSDLRLPLRGASFGPAVGRFFKKYADFKGRASRSEFWWVAVFSAVVSVVALVVPIIGWIADLALLVPNLALGARRLHDTGRSGWWQLLILIPVLGAIALIVLWCQPPSPKGDRFGPDGIAAGSR